VAFALASNGSDEGDGFRRERRLGERVEHWVAYRPHKHPIARKTATDPVTHLVAAVLNQSANAARPATERPAAYCR
jgi:hypothetical protein